MRRGRQILNSSARACVCAYVRACSICSICSIYSSNACFYYNKRYCQNIVDANRHTVIINHPNQSINQSINQFFSSLLSPSLALRYSPLRIADRNVSLPLSLSLNLSLTLTLSSSSSYSSIYYFMNDSRYETSSLEPVKKGTR